MNLNQKLGPSDVRPALDQMRLEQPIDLAHKSSSAGNSTIQIATGSAGHSVAMHAQIDTSKIPFTTLRMPLGPRLTVSAGSVPILPTNVTPQMLSSKSLVRSSTEGSHSTSTVLSQGTSSIPRHVMTTTVYPVMSLGSGSVPMASIIREAHALPASIPSHPTTLYSSHVPRGPAAVASISAGPKSAVATPMLRPTNTSVLPRTATLINRALTPTSKTNAAMLQSIEVPKLGGTTSHPGGIHLGFSSDRTFESSSVRSTLTSVGKPVHISQPIVQHLHQQVPEKGYYKSTGATILTTSQAHLLTQSGVASAAPLTSGSIGNPIINQQGRINSAACVVTIAPGTTLRTSISQQHSHGGPTHSSGNIINSHQALTLLSGKSISHQGAVTLQGAHLKSTDISAIKKVNPANNASATINALPRTIQATTAQSSGIPVAKVYPQPVTPPRSTMNVVTQEGTRGNIYITHPPHNASNSGNSNSGNLSAVATTVVLSENRNESGPIRFATIPRPTASSGTPYAVPPTAYFYESYQVPNTITMHPYASSSSNQSFPATTLPSSTLRPVGIAVSEVVTQNTGPQSTMYTVSSGGQHATSSLIATQYGGQTNQNLHTNHNTSPRPSILRKRTSDGASAGVKKNLLSSLPNLSSAPPSPTPSNNIIKTIPMKPTASREILRENSCPNVETMEKAASTILTKAEIPEQNDKVKKMLLCPPAANGIPMLPIIEASPRKKPRKQQLAANDLLESHSTDGEETFEKKIKESLRKEIKDDESSKWVTFCKRPSMSLLNSYRNTWKSRHNHFLKYTDVKPKEEKKISVNELVNQKNVLKKVNGWKIYHLTTQMDEVVELEDNVHTKISQLLTFMETTPVFKRSLSNDEEKIFGKVTDLIKGNLQRSKIVQDQVSEVKQQMVKVLDHKPNIVNIVGKYVSKRPIKKKN